MKIPKVNHMKNFNVNDQGFYGRFGGAYVPEILHANVEKLRECYLREMEDESFQQEFRLLLRDYVGRPSPLYYARRLSEKYGTRIYLKREDLNHTGAHKINNTIGQILLARRIGKKRIIAETGAGQHGVATVSYTHLDVYKRQVNELFMISLKPLAANKSAILFFNWKSSGFSL